jgi:hypothetical protein
MEMMLHEVWQDAGDDGQLLPGCCLAGPDGDAFRQSLSSGARLIHTFEAGSHLEAMTIYYQLMGWSAYRSTQPADAEPYPPEWLARQRGVSAGSP